MEGTAAAERSRCDSGAGGRLMLPGAGLLVGAWAMVPPYIGPSLNVTSRVEFADHVLPGLVVVGLSLVALLVGLRSPRSSTFMFLAGLGVVLAGLWMTATHLPLVPQATRDEAPIGSVLYHSAPGLAVLGLGVVWALAHRNDPVDPVDAAGGAGGAGQSDR